jgi:hypothetical protein
MSSLKTIMCGPNSETQPEKGEGVAAGVLARFQNQEAESRLAKHTMMPTQAVGSLYCARKAAGGVSQSGMSLFLLLSNVCHCCSLA